jgi:DNA (cytosine-5)-methyltransferase 1
MRYIDLFAGTGAFSHVLKHKGFECVFANDIEKSSEKIYLANHPDHPFVLGDLNNINVVTIPSHDLLVGGFPCFVQGTPVFTNNGYKSIETVDLADTLLTHTGRFQSIVNLQRNVFNGTLYSISIRYRPEPIICTEEHPFYVRTNRQPPRWKMAKDITRDDHVGMVINQRTERIEWIYDEMDRELSIGLALEIQQLYLRLGYIVSIDKSRNGYCITDKHTEYAFIDGNYAWFPVVDRTTHEATDTPVYNFQVANDNSYIVSNTIVHNCQPFSVAGKQEGFDDPRSNVFWKIIEIIQIHKPSIVLLENVKNLKSHDHGTTFDTISSALIELGYHIKCRVLNTSTITNVPQHRERIYILAFRKQDVYNFEFDTVENRPLSDFLETNIPSKYYYTDKLQVFPVIQASVIKPVRTTNTIYQYRRYYVRENKKNQCPTLTANMGTGGHNVPLILDTDGIRKLTPRECFNLQGFPSNYVLPTLSDSLLYKLAGNAVSVPVIELIIDRLFK